MTETLEFLATAPSGAAPAGVRPHTAAVPRTYDRSTGAALVGRRSAAPCVSPTRRSARARATYQRRRVFAVLLGVAILLMAGRAASAALGDDTLAVSGRPSTPTAELITTIVEPGDSLWSIAERLAPGRDPRPVVDALTEARGNAPLLPGETIRWYR